MTTRGRYLVKTVMIGLTQAQAFLSIQLELELEPARQNIDLEYCSHLANERIDRLAVAFLILSHHSMDLTLSDKTHLILLHFPGLSLHAACDKFKQLDPEKATTKKTTFGP